jgi:omega-hydroxy-beta-dihydromenaquinone-9 sulfotransferase
MSWRELFATHIGPGALCGITLGDWLRLLAANRFAVDPPYWVRAGMVTAASLQNSVFSWWEHWRYDQAIATTRPEPPLFVLGIWRSGTTHLHNLLARDRRLAYPNFFEVFYPHTFLSTAWSNRAILSHFLPERRPQDNVRMGIDEPQEDEFALNCLTQLSWVLLWTFPRRAGHYGKYLTFHSATDSEAARWQQALKWFVQKLTYEYRRPLVLKSPAHTGRIKLLLEAFPEAKFVHIHRNPYDVFQSGLNSALKAVPYWTMQRPDYTGLEETTLRQYEEVYQAYFEERGLIPVGRLHEIRYEALEADPLGQLRGLYSALELGDFGACEPTIRAYLDSIAGYEKNRYQELEPKWKAQVAERWRRSFDEWGYAV